LALGTHGDIFAEEEARCCDEYRSLGENTSIIRVLREYWAQTTWAEKSMRLSIFTQCAWNDPVFKFSFKFKSSFHSDDRPV
jgi:hypothetical protein